MNAPSYEARLCAMFDSFCKAVSRNCCRNLERADNNREKYFSNEPVEYLLDLLGHEDRYPSDYFVLYVEDYPCELYDEFIYKALLSLKEKQRKVILLDFWRGFSDREIADRLEVSCRTVYNLRKRAFRAILEYYEKYGISC